MGKNRQFELLYLLLEQGQTTAGALAERFGVSVRTIYRDIDALSAAGAPVYALPGKGGGIALMDRFVLSRAALTAEEQEQLLTALQSMPDATKARAAETCAKLSALFRRRGADWLQVDLSRWGSRGAEEKFDALKGAILARRVISFTYAGAGGRTERRRAQPARLVFKGQAWYLQGFCLDRRAYRTFRVSRMLGLEVLQEEFDRLPPPPPIEPEGPQGEWGVPVRLRFAPEVSYRVYDEFDEGSVTRGEGGTLFVDIDLPEDPWLYGYLLSFGTAVEVLEPAQVRERLARLAGQIVRQYENPDKGCQGLGDKMGASRSKEVPNMEQLFCQSCSMPIQSDEAKGTERDGSLSQTYCKYCYQKGAFTWPEATMEEMIDFCAPHLAQGRPGLTLEQAKAQMREFFPLLARWKA